MKANSISLLVYTFRAGSTGEATLLILHGHGFRVDSLLAGHALFYQLDVALRGGALQTKMAELVRPGLTPINSALIARLNLA